MEQLDQAQVHAVVVVEDQEQLFRRRGLGGLDVVAQDGMDLLPARVPHEGSQGAQGGRPRHGEEITDGVFVKDRIEHDDVGAQRLEHPDGALAGLGHLGVDGGIAEGGGVGDLDGDVGVVEGGQPVGLGRGSERRSVGSGPTATSRARATSAKRRAMGPLVERSGQPGGFGPPEGTRPRLGFMPARPQQALGMRMDPPPSDPVARGTMPAASAAAAPPDDPPGPREWSNRFSEGPKMLLVVLPIQPNSGVLVLPTTTQPVARRRPTKGRRRWRVDRRRRAPSRGWSCSRWRSGGP